MIQIEPSDDSCAWPLLLGNSVECKINLWNSCVRQAQFSFNMFTNQSIGRYTALLVFEREGSISDTESSSRLYRGFLYMLYFHTFIHCLFTDSDSKEGRVLKPTYAQFLDPVQNLHFVMSSKSRVVQRKRPKMTIWNIWQVLVCSRALKCSIFLNWH